MKKFLFLRLLALIRPPFTLRIEVVTLEVPLKQLITACNHNLISQQKGEPFLTLPWMLES